MTRSTYIFACALLCALLPHPAHAQHRYREGLDANHVDVKLQLGFAGSADATLDTTFGTVSASDDMDVSIGVAADYMVPLHKYFAIGGGAGFLTWETQNAGSRNVLFDFVVLPEGKFAVTRNIELYLHVPIGLSIDILNDTNVALQISEAGDLRTNSEGDVAPGFVIGTMFGARFQLARSFGLLAEMGYMYRTFGHTISASAGLGTVSRDVSVSFGQFAMNFGAYF